VRVSWRRSVRSDRRRWPFCDARVVCGGTQFNVRCVFSEASADVKRSIESEHAGVLHTQMLSDTDGPDACCPFGMEVRSDRAER
jgi:hypothetical protein